MRQLKVGQLERSAKQSKLLLVWHHRFMVRTADPTFALAAPCNPRHRQQKFAVHARPW